ncbi:putative hydrolase of the HAD superfamily [Ekhidna lutea]|uniref:Putative hydrolase of the HAD superfamily n=1 Tax=Ekhidna lutea TaxID=447679 RepID=A0A239IPF4_EKHLU|nr:YjjG family noncanonical pyrimidine nucleotidase [Ekhidna lutea]SNS94943.1 putative hydrolase of the HAD superfamily [Ekhidna lutea]
MKGIKHIFFDLDHTLWDYDRSARETLLEIYGDLNLTGLLTEKKFINTFYEVNDKLWVKYNNGLVDREYIKNERFNEVFLTSGIDVAKSKVASSYFINNCSMKPYLMSDALTALNYLSGKQYELHIITNGFLDAQNRKLSSSGIAKYFKVMVTSECANSRKPSPEIFEYSLSEAGANKMNSIMIGDNPKTDIHGAKEFGLKTVFYDPSGRKKSLADYTVQSHLELLKLF